MKNRMLIIVAVCCMAFIVMPLQAQDGAATAPELSLDEVLNKHYEALGGLERLKGVESTKMTGIISIPMQGVEFPFTRVAMRPNKLRMDSPIQGMDVIQAYDGETAWWVMPMMGSTDPQPMPEAQAQAMMQNSDMDGALIDYEAKGHTVELDGVENVNDKPAYRLAVTLADGSERSHFIDSESFLEVKIAAMTNQMGQDIMVESFFDGYAEIDGMQVWHMMTQKAMGQTSMELTVETLEFDVDMDDSMFEMPEAEPDSADGGDGSDG